MSLWGMKSTPQNRPDRPPKVVGPVPPDQSDAPQKDPPSPCDGPNDLRQDDPGRSSVAKHGTHPVSGTILQKRGRAGRILRFARVALDLQDNVAQMFSPQQ